MEIILNKICKLDKILIILIILSSLQYISITILDDQIERDRQESIQTTIGLENDLKLLKEENKNLKHILKEKDAELLREKIRVIQINSEFRKHLFEEIVPVVESPTWKWGLNLYYDKVYTTDLE